MENYVARTYRFTHHVYAMMTKEAEHRKMTEAEFVRAVIRDYFEQKDEISRLELLEGHILQKMADCEHRVIEKIDELTAMAETV